MGTTWEDSLRSALPTKNPWRVMEGSLGVVLLLISSDEDLSDLGMLDPERVGEREDPNMGGGGNVRCVLAEDELDCVKETGNGSGSLPPRGLPLFTSISKVLPKLAVADSAASLPSSGPDS